MNRGARHGTVFHDDNEYSLFLGYLADFPTKFGVEVHAYALMPNHYHLLLRSVRPNLSAAMHHLSYNYTRVVNQQHGWDGALFRGRFRAQRVGDRAYLLTVAAYIHLNPVKARLIRRLNQHYWTSHRSYLGLDRTPDWLSCDTLLGEVGGREKFGAYVGELRTGRKSWPEHFNAELGWLRRAADSQTAWSLYGSVEGEAARAVAEPAAVLKRVSQISGKSISDLQLVRFGPRANSARRFAVWALAQATDLTQLEIGARLGMSRSQVSKILSALRRSANSELQAWMESLKELG